MPTTTTQPRMRRLTLATLLALAAPVLSQDAAQTPWGISSSASSFRNHAEWFPKMAAAGVSWVRLFPEWNSVEPVQGTWKWEATDAMVKSAEENKIQVNGLLMGSTPWLKGKSHAFPMKDLDGWATFVATSVARYQDRIRYWEVWNEGNGGFNDDRHTTTDYARLAAVAYDAAHKANPKAQVGLTVASFDAPYLRQTILAQAKAGQAGRFDFLCVHPYELADGVGEGHGEIAYLGMTRLLRSVLKETAPEKENAEIWITEIGRRIEKRGGKTVTEEDASKALVKLYVMAIAQGIQRVQWFEAQDPAGEDQGFGLLGRDGKPRASYQAMKTLTARLGPAPKYLGWVAVDTPHRQSYGFVFQGATAPLLILWAPADQKFGLSFPDDLEQIDWMTNRGTLLKAREDLVLNDAPVMLSGLTAPIIEQAKANAGKYFGWGGDHSAAKTVSLKLGKAEGAKGVYQTGAKSTPAHTFADGTTGVRLKGDLSQSATFFVHPTFATIQTSDYHVRVTVRRLGPGNVGMNLNYEVADSQGRGAYKNRGVWFGLSASEDWQTFTWHVTDASFSKMWGFDFSLRPEQSVPFVVGKVEVSTEAF